MIRVIKLPEIVLGLVFDVDGTIYQETGAYREHQRKTELQALMAELGVSCQKAAVRFEARESLLARELGRKPSAGETIRALGFSQSWLMNVRRQKWDPASFIQPDQDLPRIFGIAAERFSMVFTTTSPRLIAEKILTACGLCSVLQALIVIGGEDVKKPKPDAEVYALAASRLGLVPSVCLSLGNRFTHDIAPALSIGMGGILVDGPQGVRETLCLLLGKGGAR